MAPSDNTPRGDRTDQAEIDLSVMDALLILKKPGGPDPRRRVITIYIDSSAKLMKAIRESFAEGDLTALRKAAHSLKSSSMNVGALGLGALCCDLEKLTQAGPLDDAEGLIVRAETTYKAVITSLEKALLLMK